MAYAPVAMRSAPTSRVSNVKMETVSDLKVLAEKLNPGEWKATPFSADAFRCTFSREREHFVKQHPTQPPTYSHHHV